MKGENHITILIDTEKVSEKNSTIYDKNSQWARNRKELTWPDGEDQLILWKIMLSYWCEKQDECLLVSLLLKIVLEIQLSAKRKEKEVKGIWIGKEKAKLSSFIYDMILYIEGIF